MFGFILGAVAGGLAAWWWRGDIQNYMDKRLPEVRDKAADRLTAIEERAEGALKTAREKIDRMRGTEMRAGQQQGTTGRPTSYTQGTGTGV